ncbi:MAG: SRPBCC domain-containing protein [Deltaproteobacteria bacterium]|nr:SRPBCC domain-containing protein [Deltaproteobacteria bacterium]
MAAKNKSNEIELTRIYDAPVKTVWDAWTDPKQVAQWWGPRGFTLTTHSKELKVGGHWRYTMHGPDGTDYPNTAKYLEVEKYSRLVYDHGGSDDKPALFRVTVLFSELKGKTKMELTMALATPEAAEETRKFIKKAGGDATWDRLAEYLAKETGGKEQFVINRTFDAPIELMFDVWSQPNHLAKWLAPGGGKMEFLRADITPGGSSFYCMPMSPGVKMYGRTEYRELSRPNRIVYAQQFCDENEKVARHPMSPTWPETMLTTVQFAQEGANRTRITITWEVHNATTREELETFIKARGGLTQGWTGSLDQLDAYLAQS